ncbi:hypothetical protein ALC60_08136 [Trachymyrmex zeteki]|uniref:Uncharacterized protein n=1 Tax=Mycetomoellerius zeteki TaxID=64791 RepID=A0A151WYE4_9HYME|nr:hypothetical protein ALC60_08136 [Trachymyrmex zeteki]
MRKSTEQDGVQKRERRLKGTQHEVERGENWRRRSRSAREEEKRKRNDDGVDVEGRIKKEKEDSADGEEGSRSKAVYDRQVEENKEVTGKRGRKELAVEFHEEDNERYLEGKVDTEEQIERQGGSGVVQQAKSGVLHVGCASSGGTPGETKRGTLADTAGAASWLANSRRACSRHRRVRSAAAVT